MSKTSEVKKTIANPEIHQGWEKNYRTSEKAIVAIKERYDLPREN